MTSALKSFILSLSGHLELTPAALYERQRALVRAGLLTTDGSRGPGGGVRATPTTVSLLLVSVMASESLSAAVALTKELAELKSVNNDRAPFISNVFYECFSEALSADHMLDRVMKICINRTDCSARIILFDKNIESHLLFPNLSDKIGRIAVEASIGNDLLTKIASDLRFIQEEDE